MIPLQLASGCTLRVHLIKLLFVDCTSATAVAESRRERCSSTAESSREPVAAGNAPATPPRNIPAYRVVKKE